MLVNIAGAPLRPPFSTLFVLDGLRQAQWWLYSAPSMAPADVTVSSFEDMCPAPSCLLDVTGSREEVVNQWLTAPAPLVVYNEFVSARPDFGVGLEGGFFPSSPCPSACLLGGWLPAVIALGTPRTLSAPRCFHRGSVYHWSAGSQMAFLAAAALTCSSLLLPLRQSSGLASNLENRG